MTYRPYSTLTAAGISDQRTNVSGSTMALGTPVRTTTAGDIDFVNVSTESHAFAVTGITQTSVANLSLGSVLTTGRLANLPTSFAFGDSVYVSKSGGLTNIKPSIGSGGFISGDYIILIGVIGKNADNPANKDIILNIGLVGQL